MGRQHVGPNAGDKSRASRRRLAWYSLDVTVVVASLASGDANVRSLFVSSLSTLPNKRARLGFPGCGLALMRNRRVCSAALQEGQQNLYELTQTTEKYDTLLIGMHNHLLASAFLYIRSFLHRTRRDKTGRDKTGRDRTRRVPDLFANF